MTHFSRIPPPRPYLDPDSVDYWAHGDDEEINRYADFLNLPPTTRSAIYGISLVRKALDPTEEEAA